MPYWFDGNNLIGKSAAHAREDPGTRRAFLSLLSGYAASRGGSFLVFFDGDDPEHAMPPAGVRIRFCAPRSTDDAVIEAAEGARAPREITVVTNDGGLSSRCRNIGVKTMTWPQFILKMEKSPLRKPRPAAPQDRVDLDEWTRYFGIDPESLK
jgi:hypothetical protein